MRKTVVMILIAVMLIGAVSCNKGPDSGGWVIPSGSPLDAEGSGSPNASDPAFSALPSETCVLPTEQATDGVFPTDGALTDDPDTDAPLTDDPANVTPGQNVTGAPSSQPTSTPKPTPVPPMPSGHPYPTDPKEIQYAEAGKRLMRTLMAMPGYEKLNIRARRGYPYLIAINKAQYKNTVTVYCVDEEGNYTRPYLSIVCSAGNATPHGVFNTKNKYSWHTLVGPCYGQYCTRIEKNYLFHSVPYYTMHKYDLEYKQYNKLGRLASLGCVRLPCNDAKWIYDNCPIGTTVVIYTDSSSAGPLGQPSPLRLDINNIFLRGWDPTDPDRANPWGDRYKAGYTIRSQIAQRDYEYAMAHGLWNGTINRPEAPTPTPGVTTTPAPTATPVPTEAPTNTPEPTGTPIPSDTPVIPTPTPTPTPTPVPSNTPAPDITSRPTEEPSPTVTPRPTATPRPTEEPRPTERPTEAPTPTPAPDPTDAPGSFFPRLMRADRPAACLF